MPSVPSSTEGPGAAALRRRCPMRRCPLFRLLPPIQSDLLGLATWQMDFTIGGPSTGAGQVLAGSTWNFQQLVDPQGPGGTGFNLSDAIAVTFRQ